MTAEQGYTTAMHDLVEAAKLAAETRDRGLVNHAGAEQILRDELKSRWQGRIERGELPPCYSAHLVMAITEAAAALVRTSAEIC